MGCAGEPQECKAIPILGEAAQYDGEAFDESTTYYRDEDRSDALEYGPGIVTKHKHLYVGPDGEAGAVEAFGSGNSEFVWGTGASVSRSPNQLKSIANTYKNKISERYKGATSKTAPSGREGEGNWDDGVASARNFFNRFPANTSGNNMYSFLGVL